MSRITGSLEATLPTSEPVSKTVRELRSSASDAPPATSSIDFTKFELGVEQITAVEKTDRSLFVAGQRYPLTAAVSHQLTLTEPTANLIGRIEAGITSGITTLINHAPGSGATHTVDWYLQATKRDSQWVNLSRHVTTDALVGSMRPGKGKTVAVDDGPVVKALRSGQTLVIDNLQYAEPDVRALLVWLSSGAKTFTHPGSGEPITVDPGFRLVLINRDTCAAPQELVNNANVVPHREQTKDEMAQLLVDQIGLAPADASLLASVHAGIVAGTQKDSWFFGRDFPLSWPLLERVGLRLASRNLAFSKADITKEFESIYGNRLVDGRESFSAWLTKTLGAPAISTSTARLSKSPQSGFVRTPRLTTALQSSLEALHAREPLLLVGPPQCGTTRLLEELGTQLKTPVCTLVGNPVTDPQSLLEVITFDEAGGLLFKEGPLTRALLNDELVYVDHADYLDSDAFNALVELAKSRRLSVCDAEGNRQEIILDKPPRIVFSLSTDGSSLKYEPSAAERAAFTEVHLPAPSVDEVEALLPANIAQDVRKQVVAIIQGLSEEGYAEGAIKLQQVIDFAKAANVLTDWLPADMAVAKAARMIFPSAENTATFATKLPSAGALEQAVEKASVGAPLWMKLIGTNQQEVDEILQSSPNRLTRDVEKHLDTLALCARIGRGVFAIGPPGSGKTVLGHLFSELQRRQAMRYNVSSSTDIRDVKGAPAPFFSDGKVSFQMIPGVEVAAAMAKSNLILDEMNLNPELQLAFKPLIDHRHLATDPENDFAESFEGCFFFATGNYTDAKTGRQELLPTVLDCLTVVHVAAKPKEEKLQILEKGSTLRTEHLSLLNDVFIDYEALAKRGVFTSNIVPMTFAERDMLKAARISQHIIAREGVSDAEEQRRILGRETSRMLCNVMTGSVDRKTVQELVSKRFGNDVSSFETEQAFRVETHKINGKNCKCLCLGAAVLPMRVTPKSDELKKLIRQLDKIVKPIGPQWSMVESLMLCLEVGLIPNMVGPTGEGKTKLTESILAQAQWPTLEQSFYADMEREHLFARPIIGEDGNITVQQQPLLQSALYGIAAILDEYCTADNAVREEANPAFEGSDIHVTTIRPEMTIKKADIHPDSRWLITTNVRDSGISAAEASRFYTIAWLSIEKPEDFRELRDREYLPELISVPNKHDALGMWVEDQANIDDQFSTVNSAIEALLSRTGVPPPLPAKPIAPQLFDLERATEMVAIAAREGLRGRAWLDYFATWVLSAANDQQTLSLVASTFKTLNRRGLGPAATLLLEKAEACAQSEKKFLNIEDGTRATELFLELKQLQQNSGEDKGTTPLSPRTYDLFMRKFLKLTHTEDATSALHLATQLVLLKKLPASAHKKAMAALLRIAGEANEPLEVQPPRVAGDRIQFMNASLPVGSAKPWVADNLRFTWTTARCQNARWLGHAVNLGAPIRLDEDANGENLELVQEMGHITGNPVTVVTLPPGVDLETLIEKPEINQDGGFDTQLRQIAQAVAAGHWLVIKGAGNIHSDKLERLNSLGDDRRGIELPKSNKWLKAAPGFRMFYMRQPNAPFAYSEALENRLVQPPLTTQSSSDTLDAAVNSAGELMATIYGRTGVDVEVAKQLAQLHTLLNDLNRRGGEFASGNDLGSFLNRDAIAVAQRLFWLREKGIIEAADQFDALHALVENIYGERYELDLDRLRLSQKWIPRAFSTKVGLLPERDINALGEPSLGEYLARFGGWAVRRQPRSQAFVPTAHPPETQTIRKVVAKMFAAFQFDEAVHLHGDDFVIKAALETSSNWLRSPLVELEGNEQTTETELFGGYIQDKTTGKLIASEGILWEAQRTGGTVVVRHASLLPTDVVSQLMSVASSGRIERTRGGIVEVQPLNFRLVLATGDHEPPLPRELASLLTRVNAPSIRERTELLEVLNHVLDEVPGTVGLSSALLAVTERAEKLSSKMASAGVTDGLFDAKRAIFAAVQLRERVLKQNVPLHSALAEISQRWFISAFDTNQKAKIELQTMMGQSVDVLSKSQLVANNKLAARVASTDELSQLRRDFERWSEALAPTVLRSIAESIEPANASIDDITQTLELIVSLGIVPTHIEQRIAETLRQIAKLSGKVDSIRERLIQLSSYLKKQSEEVCSVEVITDEFLRSSRLSDVEKRFQVIDEYLACFERLASLQSPLSIGTLADLQSAGRKYSEQKVIARMVEAKRQVEQALSTYQQRQGESDDELNRLSRDLLEVWDSVSKSPLFREHRLLRGEFQQLNTALQNLSRAHARRGEAVVEVESLLLTLKDASEIFEAARISEQSGDLRRSLASAKEGSQNLIAALSDEVEEIHRLEEAREKFNVLKNTLSAVTDAASQGTTTIRIGDAKFESAQVDRDALMIQARNKAEDHVRQGFVRTERIKSSLALVDRFDPSQLPPVESFFSDYDPAYHDHGIGPLEPVRRAPTENELWIDSEEERIAASLKSAVEEAVPSFFEELLKQEQQRFAQVQVHNVRSTTTRAVAEARATVQKTIQRLEHVSNQLDLERSDPGLFAEWQQLKQNYQEASGALGEWSDIVSKLLSSEGLLSRIASFFGSKSKAEINAPPVPSLVEVGRAEKAFIAKLTQKIQGRMDDLPEFAHLREKEALREELLEKLAGGETIGTLSARYAEIAQSLQGTEKTTDPRVAQDLKIVANAIAPTVERRRLLSLAHRFIEDAEQLAAFYANRSVSVANAPVIEGLIQAAEVVRAQTFDASFRDCLKELDRALDRLKELENADELIRVVGEEARDLRDTLSALDGSSAVKLSSAGTSDLLAQFMKAAPAPIETASTRVTPNSLGTALSVSGPKPSTQLMNTLANAAAQESIASNVVRSGQVRLLQLEFTSAASDVANETTEPSTWQADVFAQYSEPLDTFTGAAEQTLARIGTNVEELLRVLSVTEDKTTDTLFDVFNRELDELASGLEMARTGQSGRNPAAESGRLVQKLRDVFNRMSALDQFPPSAMAPLSGPIIAANDLARSFGSPNFAGDVQSWAASAIVNVRQAQNELIGAKLSRQKNTLTADQFPWDRLSETIEHLSVKPCWLGAHCVHQMLSHTASRLEALHDVFPEIEWPVVEGIQASVAQALVSAQAYPTSDGAELAIGTLVESVEKLGHALASTQSTKAADISKYVEILGLVSNLVFETTAAQTIECVDKIQQKVVGLNSVSSAEMADVVGTISASLTELQTTILTQRLGNARTTFNGLAAKMSTDAQTASQSLDDALNAYLHFAEGQLFSLSEVEQQLRNALIKAYAQVGPAQFSVAQRVLEFRPEFESITADLNPELASSAALLEQELGVYFQNAADVSRSSLSGEVRLAHVIELISERFATIETLNNPARADVERVEQVMEQLQELSTCGRRDLNSCLEKIEALMQPPENPSEEQKPEDKEVAPVLSDAAFIPSRVSASQETTDENLVQLVTVGSGAPTPHQGTVGQPATDSDGQEPREGTAGYTGVLNPVNLRNDGGESGIVLEELANASKSLEVVTFDVKDIKRDRQLLMKQLAADAQSEVDGGVLTPAKKLTELQEMLASDQALIQRIATAMRCLGGADLVIVVDQSGSTSGSCIQHEARLTALLMEAARQAEGNCAVVGFGVRGYDIKVHKSLMEPINDESIQNVFEDTSEASGGTTFRQPLEVALGQLSTNPQRNKYVLFLTDAEMGEVGDARACFPQCRKKGVGLGMVGFGNSRLCKEIAGEFGVNANSYKDAIDMLESLFSNSAVANTKGFAGGVSSVATGVGVATGEMGLEDAPSSGPMACVLRLAEPVREESVSDDSYQMTGPAREARDLVNRKEYQRVLSNLENTQRQAEGTASYKQCLQIVRETKVRHDLEGIIELIGKDLQRIVPKGRGMRWLRKQRTGSTFDETALPLWQQAQEQGLPYVKIFKKRIKAKQTTPSYVIAIDESSSVGDSQKMLEQLNTAYATGDAIKKRFPNARIAVVGFSDRTRLHLGFEQKWDDEHKAHILNQVQGGYQATDDERCIYESVEMLRMQNGDSKAVILIGDGQGMPGAEVAMNFAESSKVACSYWGVGSGASAVAHFEGDANLRGAWAPSLMKLVPQAITALEQSYERAGYAPNE